MPEFTTIDGSYGEGGGQILRTALTLACLLGEPMRVENIRAGRKNPGLQPQHLTCALAVAKISGGKLNGAEPGSTWVEFEPGKSRPGDYSFDVSEVRSSAGSVNLILHTVLLPLVVSGGRSQLEIKGGTHVPFSPPFNHVRQVYLPMLHKLGIIARAELHRAGYYPTGGGHVTVNIEPTRQVQSLVINEPGDLLAITCISGTSNLPGDISPRQLRRAMSRIQEAAPAVDIEESEVVLPSAGHGTFVFITAESEHCLAGFGALGERDKRAEQVADEAGDAFQQYVESGAALDKHLADQIILPMAFAEGVSEFTTAELTRHLLTNIWVIRQLLPEAEIHVEGELGKQGRVRIEGAGFTF